MTGLPEPERVFGTYVTASAFDMLGVAPLMGRALLPEDQDAPGVVVLSYALWQNQLGGSPDVLGTSLELDGTAYTVVGVMPEGFDVPSPWSQMGSFRVYLPFQNERLSGNRGSHGFPVIARLAPGQTKETAQADMDRIMRELAAEYPQTNADRSAKVFTVHEYLFGRVGRQLGLILGAAGRGAPDRLRQRRGPPPRPRGRAARRSWPCVPPSVPAGGPWSGSSSPRRCCWRWWAASSACSSPSWPIDGLKAVLPPSIPRIDRIRVDGWALAFALGASGLHGPRSSAWSPRSSRRGPTWRPA